MVYVFEYNIVTKFIIFFTIMINSTYSCAQVGNLTIKIAGVKDLKGDIHAFIYSSKDGFPVDLSKAAESKMVKANTQTLTLKFSNIKHGFYAVSVYHDKDSNGRVSQWNDLSWDSNILGIPIEPVGVSNNAKGSFGPPKFEDAKFYLDKDITIEITIE